MSSYYFSGKQNSQTRLSRFTNQRQQGFSLPELLIVVACIGILAMISAPMVEQSKRRARLTAGYADSREMITTQHQYHLQNKRFARLDELNAFRNGYLGTMRGTSLTKGDRIYQLLPSTPTDDQLVGRFFLLATLVNTDGSMVQLLGNDSGEIKQLTR